MNEISFKTSEGHELCKNAELIGEDQISVVLDDGISRKFVLQVFAIEGGGYIPVVEYQSGSSTEQSVRLFEEMDTQEDIEKFYYVFDICEFAGKNADLPRHEKEQLASLTKRLAKEYETLMFRFLEDVKSQIAVRGFGDRKPDKAVKSGSIWNMFRTK